MNISRDTWHYKLVDFYAYSTETNLCPYIRQVLGGCLLGLLIVFASTLGIYLLLWPLLYYIFPAYAFADFIGGAIIVWVVVGIFSISVYRDTDHYFKAISSKKGYSKPKEKGLFRLWLEAKHDKVCPQLTFNSKEGK